MNVQSYRLTACLFHYCRRAIVWSFLFTLPTALLAQNPCDTLFVEETLNIAVQDCNAMVPVCLPIYEEAFLTYDFFDNGLRYQNGINGCDVDTLVAYSYNGLLGAGSLGPYFVESWSVNGNIFTGEFFDIPALVDSMNIWDPLGNWQQDSTLAFSVSGGFNDHFYGALNVSKPGVNNSTSTLGINYGIQPKGTQISLTFESHQLVINDTALGCLDTLQINMACLPTATINEVIYINNTDNFCLDVSELPGNLQSITELATINNTGITTLTMNGLATCIDYTANATGQTTHLLLACDDLGFCDSTYVDLEIKEPEDQLFTVNLAPGETSQVCVNTSSLIGAVDRVDSLCAHGDFVNFTYNPITHCIIYEAVDFGVETACYELCDQLGGCLMVEVEVTVRENQITPVTQNDVDTLVGNEQQILDLTLNDTYNPLTDSLDFPTLPINGTVEHLGNGQVAYQPINNNCGLDYFTYRLCNANGCSIAAVSLERLCDEIKVFSGFSPNGDARNDFFNIQGVEAFPESELQIFDRWGVSVFTQVGYQNDWSGEWSGNNLPDGTYFYFLELNDGSMQQFSGYIQLHR